jgi:hypothetical protein
LYLIILTSQPMFLIIRILTYSLAMTVNKAAMVTVNVAPRITGPWFSSGRRGGLSRWDSSWIANPRVVSSCILNTCQRDFLLDDRSWSAIGISGRYVYNSLLHVDLHRAYDHICGPLLGHSSATGGASRCGVHDKSSQMQATWGSIYPAATTPKRQCTVT